MRTEALDNCLRILNGLFKKNNALIAELLGPNQDIEWNFITPFSRELNINLIDKKGDSWEKLLLEHYIKELDRYNLFFFEHSTLLFDKVYLGKGKKWKGYFEKEKEIKHADIWECYILTAFILYENLFHEINTCCSTNSLDFFKLCRGLNLNTGIYKAILIMRKNSHREGALEYWLNQRFDTFQLDKFQKSLLIHNAIYIIGGMGLGTSPFMKAFYSKDPSTDDNIPDNSENNELNKKTIEKASEEHIQISNLTAPLEIHDIEKELAEISKMENHFWKGLPMDAVIKHFEVMTVRKNKNDEFFLTKSQFISFLKKGFLNDNSQPKQKINYAIGEKGFVIKLFYLFFDLAVTQYGYNLKRERFINLVNDCFDNWEPNTIETFFKRKRTNEEW